MHWREPNLDRMRGLEEYLNPVYAQCWSNTEESDTLLRAYSRVVKDSRHQRNLHPGNEGVRVTSTPRKLLQLVESNERQLSDFDIYAGAVKYMSTDDVGAHVLQKEREVGIQNIGSGRNRAETLLLKRSEFSSENEVRILLVKKSIKTPKDKNVLSIRFDPSEVFDKIVLDPRLVMFEADERKDWLKRRGYKGTIYQSGLYIGRRYNLIDKESI